MKEGNNFLSPEEWDFLTDAIASEKVVLLMGPEAMILEDGKTVAETLLQYLDVENNDKILDYYERDELFLFSSASDKTFTYYKLRRFYERLKFAKIYEDLIDIPFHLFLSINPDTHIKKSFELKQIPVRSNFFSKSRPIQNDFIPSKDTPLIYNLFGNINEEESLILTYDDLIEFLFAVLKSQGLPLNLRNSIQEADFFIFLGFKFEKWYLQTLLKILNPDKEKFTYAFNRNIAAETKSFLIDHFRIHFIDSDITSFVSALHKECLQKNMLRSITESPEEPDPEPKQESTCDKIKKLIVDNEISDAIEILMDLADEEENQDLEHTLLVLSNRFMRLMSNSRKGTISEEEKRIENGKIIDALLGMLKEIDC